MPEERVKCRTLFARRTEEAARPVRVLHDRRGSMTMIWREMSEPCYDVVHIACGTSAEEARNG